MSAARENILEIIEESIRVRACYHDFLINPSSCKLIQLYRAVAVAPGHVCIIETIGTSLRNFPAKLTLFQLLRSSIN